jgi:hypothetical protein
MMSTRPANLGVLASAAVLTAAVSGGAMPALAHSEMAGGHSVPASVGAMTSITSVPGSSEALAIHYLGSGPSNNKEKVGVLQGHHWKKIKANFGGRYGLVNVTAAGSKKTVWVAGSRQQPKPDIQELPAIYRLKGRKLVESKLPTLDEGDTAITSISASSSSNAWAVGDQLFPDASAQHVALHWNGKKWSLVDVPAPFTSVGTSSPGNAWAIADGATYRWDGHAWTQLGTMPTGITAMQIATSAANRAYTVGPGGIARWTGTKWVKAHAVSAETNLRSITMHGKSAWAAGYRGVTGGARGVILHSSGGKWKLVKISGKVYQFNTISTSNGKKAFASGNRLDSRVGGRTVVASVSAHKAKAINSKF